MGLQGRRIFGSRDGRQMLLAHRATALGPGIYQFLASASATPRVRSTREDSWGIWTCRVGRQPDTGSFPVLPVSDTTQAVLPCHQGLLKFLALFLESV